MMQYRLTLLAFLTVFACELRADVIHLTTGGEVRGELLNPKQTPRENYEVLTLDGIRVTFGKRQVKRVVRSQDPEALYEEYLPEMPASADGNWKMAEWCLKTGLLGKRAAHLEAVVRLDPDHEQARRALGYQMINGKWQKRTEYWENRGYIRHKGDWKLPQEVARDEAEEARETKEIEWRKRLKLWRTWILKQRGKQGEGAQNIRDIRDTSAVRPLLDLLDDDKEPPQLKLLYIAVLSEIQSPVSTGIFAKLALHDADSRVRDACLSALEKYGSAVAVDIFIPHLTDKSNTVVNRAALGIGRLKDTRATVPLIEALTTEHKLVIPGRGGNIGASFDKNGGGGLSTGGGPKVIRRVMQNRAVLNALSAIHSGVNYQFDKERWRRWYEETNTPKQLSLRRVD